LHYPLLFTDFYQRVSFVLDDRQNRRYRTRLAPEINAQPVASFARIAKHVCIDRRFALYHGHVKSLLPILITFKNLNSFVVQVASPTCRAVKKGLGIDSWQHKL
jgi:hypothetical protein